MCNFNVELNISTNGKANIEIKTNENIYVLKYILKRYGIKVQECDSLSLSHSFTLIDEGIYVACVVAKINNTIQTRFSYPKSYFKKETIKNFENLSNKFNSKDLNLPKISLTKLNYPYSYISLIFNKTNKNYNLNELLIDNNLKSENITFNSKKHQLIFSNNIFGKTTKILFSGMANHNGKFLFGIEDVNDENIDFSEDIGNFTAIVANDKQIKLLNDYFAFSKSYYFENDDVFIFSNQFHFLLLILNQLKIKPTLNEDIIKGSLSCNNYNFAQQIYSTQTFFNEIKLVPYNKFIEINKNEISLKYSKFNNLLNMSPEDLSDKEFFDLIDKAETEIVNNIQCVFDNKKIDKVVIDVTGGADSRMVLSALTNIKDFKNKVKVRTLNISEDLNVSKDLTNLLNLEYDDSPSYSLPYDEALSNKLSLLMGGSNKIYPIKNELYADLSKNKIYLSGGYGEQMTRYYLTKSFINGYLENEFNSQDFISEYIKNISMDSISYISDYDTAVKYTEKTFLDQFNNLVGCDNLEKLESHFLAFRGGFHFKQYMFVGNIWTPLQSKYLYTIFKKTPRNSPFFKLTFETIFNLNPVLGNVKFADETYNESMDKIKSSLRIKDEKYRYLNLVPNYDSTKKDFADSNKIKNSKTLTSKFILSVYDQNKYNNQNSIFFDEATKYILYLSTFNDGKYKNLAQQLYFYLNYQGSTKHISWLWARLLVLLLSITFFEKE